MASMTAFQAVRTSSNLVLRSNLRSSDIGSPRPCQGLRTGSIPVGRSKFISRNREVWLFSPALDAGDRWFESSFLDHFEEWGSLAVPAAFGKQRT